MNNSLMNLHRAMNPFKCLSEMLGFEIGFFFDCYPDVEVRITEIEARGEGVKETPKRFRTIECRNGKCEPRSMPIFLSVLADGKKGTNLHGHTLEFFYRE